MSIKPEVYVEPPFDGLVRPFPWHENVFVEHIDQADKPLTTIVAVIREANQRIVSELKPGLTEKLGAVPLYEVVDEHDINDFVRQEVPTQAEINEHSQPS